MRVAVPRWISVECCPSLSLAGSSGTGCSDAVLTESASTRGGCGSEQARDGDAFRMQSRLTSARVAAICFQARVGAAAGRWAVAAICPLGGVAPLSPRRHAWRPSALWGEWPLSPRRHAWRPSPSRGVVLAGRNASRAGRNASLVYTNLRKSDMRNRIYVSYTYRSHDAEHSLRPQSLPAE